MTAWGYEERLDLLVGHVYPRYLMQDRVITFDCVACYESRPGGGSLGILAPRVG